MAGYAMNRKRYMQRVSVKKKSIIFRDETFEWSTASPKSETFEIEIS